MSQQQNKIRSWWLYKPKFSIKWHCSETLDESERIHTKHTKEFHTERGFEQFKVLEAEPLIAELKHVLILAHMYGGPIEDKIESLIKELE